MARRYENAAADCRELAAKHPGVHFYAVPTSRTRRFFDVMSEHDYQQLHPRPEWKRPLYAWVERPAEEEA